MGACSERYDETPLYCDWRKKLEGINQKCEGVGRTTETYTILKPLYGRIMQGARSTLLLREKAHGNTVVVDATTIARSVYDASLQLLFILNEDSREPERLKDYRDFYWVEKQRLMTLFEENPTAFARQAIGNEFYKENRGKIMEQYERVAPRYKNGSGKMRANWYRGSLRTIAKEVGYEKEYELFQKVFSSVLHGSMHGLQHTLFRIPTVTMFVWLIATRSGGKLAEVLHIELNDEELSLVEYSKENLLDKLPNGRI